MTTRVPKMRWYDGPTSFSLVPTRIFQRSPNRTGTVGALSASSHLSGRSNSAASSVVALRVVPRTHALAFRHGDTVDAEFCTVLGVVDVDDVALGRGEDRLRRLAGVCHVVPLGEERITDFIDKVKRIG